MQQILFSSILENICVDEDSYSVAAYIVIAWEEGIWSESLVNSCVVKNTWAFYLPRDYQRKQKRKTSGNSDTKFQILNKKLAIIII